MGKFSEMDAVLAPYVRGSSTSLAAAVSLGDRNPMRKRIMEYLASTGGATDEQMQIGLDMKASTQRPRRIELVEQGRVKDSGRYALTSSKRKATIWVCCE